MKKLYLLVALFMAFTLFSCSKKTSAQDTGMSQNDSVAAAPSAAPPSAKTKSTRLMVKNASMRVQVVDVPKAVDSTTKIIETAGGYVFESNLYGNNTAHLRFGVPSASLDSILGSISKIGEETSRSVSAEDVTDQVVDMEAELANRKILRDRLRALLSKAKDVKDVLAVEAELTRIQTEIDSIEGRLKKMKENISFSKVSLELYPKGPEKKQEILGPLGYVYFGVKWFVTKLFVIQSGD